MSSGPPLGDIFVGDPPDRVTLPDTPLIRVVCQVRFDRILGIRNEDRIAPFQDALRLTYPRFSAERGRGIAIGNDGVQVSDENLVWRFEDPNDAYRVSLAPDFLSVETTRYTSREDLFARVETAVDALARTDLAPGETARIGLRYIDRVAGDQAVYQLTKLVRPEIAGMLTLLADGRADLQQSIQDSIIRHGEVNIRTRVAYLPPRTTFDPGLMEGDDMPSWILDIDASTPERMPYDSSGVRSVVEDLADKCQRVFRWAVYPEFLRHFGGDV